jgi:hypothetical protein
MANPQHLLMLDNPANFPPGQDVKQLDFSGATISPDFSGRRLFEIDFFNCVLAGSKFKDCLIKECNFFDSDWNGCDFEGVIFDGSQLGKIKNANKASNLFSVTVAGAGIDRSKFETAVKSWQMWIDWERLGTAGKLPLFGVSTTALVAMPIYFHFLAHYNHSLGVLKNSINSSLPSAVASPLEVAIAKLPVLPIPGLSIVALISALCLALGAVLYSFFCPPLPKQFSLAQWQYQLQRPTLAYLAESWSRPRRRIACAIFYLVGGLCGLYVLSVKLWQTAVYIWHG